MAATLKRVPGSGGAGFTLLEMLVALAIASLILLGVYRVVEGTASRQKILAERQERVQLWFYLRRLLRRDVEALQGDDAKAVTFDADGGLTLLVSGGVVPGWRLGPRVAVHYRWEPLAAGEAGFERWRGADDGDEAGLRWVREVRPPDGGDGEPGLNVTLETALREVRWEILDQDGWKPLGEGAKPPFLALRWQFRWADIGEWTLVRAIRVLK